MSRKLYTVAEVGAAVLDKMREAERRAILRGYGPMAWCYSALEPVAMPDGGSAPHGKVQAALLELQAAGRVTAGKLGSGWRLSPSEVELQRQAIDAFERR